LPSSLCWYQRTTWFEGTWDIVRDASTIKTPKKECQNGRFALSFRLYSLQDSQFTARTLVCAKDKHAGFALVEHNTGDPIILTHHQEPYRGLKTLANTFERDYQWKAWTPPRPEEVWHALMKAFPDI
jgi:hypothetical protein